MKVISFKSFNEVPVCVRVAYGIVFVLAMAGLVTMCLDIFEICEIKLCVSLALIVGSILIQNMALAGYKSRLYKKIGDDK